MNLAQLYYFRKLAQLEHYTQAAQELFLALVQQLLLWKKNCLLNCSKKEDAM